MEPTDNETHTLTGTSTNHSPTNARPKFSRPRVPSHRVEHSTDINAHEGQCQEHCVQAKEVGRQEGIMAGSEELTAAKDELKISKQKNDALEGQLLKIRERNDQLEIDSRQDETQKQDLISHLNAERRQYRLQADKHNAESSLLAEEKSEAIAEAIRQEKKCLIFEKKLLDAELRASDWQNEYEECKRREETLKGRVAHLEGRDKNLSIQCAALAATVSELNGTNEYLQEQAVIVTNAMNGVAEDLMLLPNATVNQGSSICHDHPVPPSVECHVVANSATPRVSSKLPLDF